MPFSPKKQAAKKRVALPLYRGYFQNLPQLRCCFPKKSEKNITSTPLTIKIPPLFCYTLFQLFFKNFCLSTADYHFFASKRSHLFKKFFKKKLHTADYHIFSAFCFCILEKKLKIFPSGNKELIAGYNQQQSSRTGILTPAALREICIYYCY